MKKLFALVTFCFLFNSAAFAHELTTADKQEAKSMALFMTSVDVACFLMVGGVVYECVSQLLGNATGLQNFSKGAGLGVAAVTAAGLCEALHMFFLKSAKEAGVADQINAFACKKNKEYRANVIGCALVGGVLGALVL